MKILYLILFALVCPALHAEELTIEDWPLHKVVNPETGKLNILVLSFFWEDYCAQTTKDELTDLLTPFKSVKSIQSNPRLEMIAERFLADIFWIGDCVHEDKDFARPFYQDAAYKHGLDPYMGYISMYYIGYQAKYWPEESIINPSKSGNFPQFKAMPEIDDLTKNAILVSIQYPSPYFNGHTYKEQTGFLGFSSKGEPTFILEAREKLVPVSAYALDGASFMALQLRSGKYKSTKPHYFAVNWLINIYNFIQHPYSGQMAAYWLREKEFLNSYLTETSNVNLTKTLFLSNQIFADLINRGNQEVLPFAFCLLSKHPFPGDEQEAALLNIARMLKEVGNEAAMDMLPINPFVDFILDVFEMLSPTPREELRHISAGAFPDTLVDVDACMAKVAPGYKWREFGLDRM